MELWDIYTESGEKTGRTIVRGEPLQSGDYHLVVHIWPVNREGKFLVQKRADHLSNLPGLWAATGGSALAGESALEAAVRETHEELGVLFEADQMKLLHRYSRVDNHTTVWFVESNHALSEFDFDREEVSQVSWETKERIEQMVSSGEFHDYGRDYFSLIFQQ